MRLAFFVVHSCPMGMPGSKDTGGMNVYVRELAANLGLSGHAIDIYTRQHDDFAPPVTEIAPNVRLIHIQSGQLEETDKVTMFHNLSEFIDNLEQFREINHLEYDLIFSHYWISGAAGLELQEKWNVPHLVMFHTLGIVKEKSGTGEREPEIRLATELCVARQTHGIIASTPEEKELIVSEFAVDHNKIAVIPCGVNMDLFTIQNKQECRHKLSISPTDKLILFVGRLDKIKGIDRLLEAAAKLRKTANLRVMIVAGNEKDRVVLEKLQEITSHAGLQNLVEFRDAVPQDELPCYYGAADVFVLPSFSESFGMVAIEALACGTPVVATRVGNMKDIIAEGMNGHLIRDNNPELLADAIEKVLENAPEYKPGIIRETVTYYNWPDIAHKIELEMKRLKISFYETIC